MDATTLRTAPPSILVREWREELQKKEAASMRRRAQWERVFAPVKNFFMKFIVIFVALKQLCKSPNKATIVYGSTPFLSVINIPGKRRSYEDGSSRHVIRHRRDPLLLRCLRVITQA